MIRLQKCYSNSKARKMQENKLKVKQLKASLKDYLYIALTLFVVSSFFANFDIKITFKGIENNQVETKEVIAANERFVKEPDMRVKALQEYLEDKKSPLGDYSELIIKEADKYGLDWTKIVAISCIESACGLKLPNGSHNAWGLGGSKFMYFKSWEESIKYVSNLIGTKYKQAENHGIKYSYCPESSGCNPSWAFIVTNTSNEILALEGK
ncbi:glucosaminidase domain-containing protein [Candidatus Roizmanbacteria bacterium]|nr:glucosaminidase domain-containing protein [Candidatus Roizmanbacteria bacterium]